jgi:hypothetical protein
MTRPSSEQLLVETARLAFLLHWPLDTILDLEHADRRRFLAEADAMTAAHPHLATGRPIDNESAGAVSGHANPGWPLQEG